MTARRPDEGLLRIARETLERINANHVEVMRLDKATRLAQDDARDMVRRMGLFDPIYSWFQIHCFYDYCLPNSMNRRVTRDGTYGLTAALSLASISASSKGFLHAEIWWGDPDPTYRGPAVMVATIDHSLVPPERRL